MPLTQRPDVTPYMAAGSLEAFVERKVIATEHGIGYADETAHDRDSEGVLWREREEKAEGSRGRIRFADVHPQRQRQAMKDLLCHICGGAADRTADGVLWLIEESLQDIDEEFGSSGLRPWPEGLVTVHPPICLDDAARALRQCPHLLDGGAVAVYVREPVVSGVYGVLYQPSSPAPRPLTKDVVFYGTPDVRWIRANQQAVTLYGCSVADPRTLSAAAQRLRPAKPSEACADAEGARR